MTKARCWLPRIRIRRPPRRWSASTWPGARPSWRSLGLLRTIRILTGVRSRLHGTTRAGSPGLGEALESPPLRGRPKFDRPGETFSPRRRMRRYLSGLHELRLADLLTLLAVHRTGSISGAARELRVTPSQVSKAMARLERHFGVRLLSRGARGVVPTPAGRQMLPRIAHAVQELQATAVVREDQAPSQELTVAGPSYLVANVLPAITELLPRTRVRSLELAPAVLRSRLAENVFDVVL